MPAATVSRIEECWQQGQSIGSTRKSLRRDGRTASFEDVRHLFAKLSWTC